MKKLYAVAAMAVMLCLTGLALSGEAQAQQCVDNGDGTVTDNVAGLMWQKGTEGQPKNWKKAKSQASGLALGGHTGWHLPDRHALLGLYISPCKEMMSVEPTWYWSSSLYEYDNNYALAVDFSEVSMWQVITNDYHVRAVRRL
ncbi:Protein of unknown function [Desulfonatronum zhilinae]|nr:Protein of unknown function [Desulfonatronum zhilinae]